MPWTLIVYFTGILFFYVCHCDVRAMVDNTWAWSCLPRYLDCTACMDLLWLM